MKYHLLKMEEVNDTMRHIWNKTYQGTGMHSSSHFRCNLKWSYLKTSMEFGSVMIAKVVLLSARIITESAVVFQACRQSSYILGRDDERPSRNGHARALFGWAKDASIYHHSACPVRLVWSKLWNTGA